MSREYLWLHFPEVNLKVLPALPGIPAVLMGKSVKYLPYSSEFLQTPLRVLPAQDGCLRH